MRRLALAGLVTSLLLGAIAVAVASDNVGAKRNEQDRALQTATSAEISLISGGERQTTSALALMLVNPAVVELLSGQERSPAARRADVASSALALETIQRTAFVPFSAACMDDRAGRQLVCAPMGRPAVFPRRLGEQFVALAKSAAIGATSGTFVSPASGQLSVAFLAPFHLHGQLLGLVHLDVGIADARGSSLLSNDTPGVEVQLAGYENGRLLVEGGPSTIAAGKVSYPATLAAGLSGSGSSAHYTLYADHRTMIAALPLTIGRGKERVAVVATALARDPGFFSAWTPGMLAVLALALLSLGGSITGLIASNRILERELSTDPLTGLRNRRALMEELPRVCMSATEDEPAFLWYFDLNGFKMYNDSFGHVAGDALLKRIGARLAGALEPRASCYRLGGDEFCVLVARPLDDPHALFATARQALAEQGGAFTVTASAGAVELPREARDPTEALRLADQRMYGEKGASASGAAELVTAALHAVLAQRHPDLGEHSEDVTSDIEALARAVGLDDEATNVVIKAGDLHDIGKLGIPDEIIGKPGPLTATEWEFMKQHTLMGEQIIAAAGPSLERVRPLVRASHERWDGTGYPDGLAGEQIPLGARIIAVCDSFSAMTTERVYKRALSSEQALEELRRCAGTQFDPHLVEAFSAIIAGGLERAAAPSANA